MPRRLLILPTLDHVDDALTSAQPPAGATTIGAVEAAVSALAMAGRRRLSSGGRKLALLEILRTAENLPAFQSVAKSQGFATIVESFLLEVIAGGVNAKGLHDAALWSAPSQRRRLLALSQVAAAYEDILAKRRLVDAPFAMVAACKKLETGTALPTLLAGYDELVFEHIIEWSPGRVRLLKALSIAQRRAGGTTEVRLPECEDDSEVSEVISPALEAIEGSDADVTLSRSERPPNDRNTAAFTAADEAGELREVSARVLALVRQGVPVSDIAIGANAMRDSAQRMRQALGDLGIPARFGGGQSLARTHIARLSHAFAAWGPLDNATRETVCAILGSRALNLKTWAQADLPATEIIRHIRAAAVRSRVPDRQGRDGFAIRLERYARSLDVDNPHGAERVRRAAALVARLFNRLDARPVEATLIDHGRALVELMQDLGVTAWLQQAGVSADPSVAPNDLMTTSLAQEQAAWAHLLEVLRDAEDSARALDLKGRVVPRDEFATWLDQSLSGASFQPGTSRGAAVELFELADLGGRTFRHVFVIGAYDGRLPRPPAHDNLFADDERWSINKLFGHSVLRVSPTSTSHSPFPSASLIDAASLALAADAAAGTLTVSHARSDDRGKPLAPSPLLSLLSPTLSFEQVPFSPVDPALARRRSNSIDERRKVATERARYFRGEAETGAFTGDVSGVAPVLQPLAAGRPDLPWSASALEKLANCNFRYLAEWAWRAKEIHEPEDEPGPMEVGRIAHLAAEVAARAMVEGRVWSSKTADEAVALGLRTATATLDEAEQATVLGHPEAWEITRKRMLRRLGLMLEREIQRTVEQGVVPYALEMGFGVDDANLPTLEVAGVHVWGQIDRVDIGPTSVMVLDYKSGRTINNAKRFAEENLFEFQLQLPLYVAAVDRLLPQAAGKNIDAVYVSLRDTKRSKTLNEAVGAETTNVPERLEEAVRKLTDRVRGGRFPITPHTCIGCHLQPACRIPERQGI